MIKKFILTLLTSLILIAFIMQVAYSSDYSLLNILNMTFTIGVIYFAIGLSIITEARKIFFGIGYTFKILVKGLSRKNYSYSTYYKEQIEKELSKIFGLNMFFVGLIHLAFSITVSSIVYL
ncbi:MAG: DUF3899 domain-containing protein [Candidatus Izimaplasma sp.]|nr:DUF3899 domain-containing protein [Candidatus Izimaplasma bacterium]